MRNRGSRQNLEGCSDVRRHRLRRSQSRPIHLAGHDRRGPRRPKTSTIEARKTKGSRRLPSWSLDDSKRTKRLLHLGDGRFRLGLRRRHITLRARRLGLFHENDGLAATGLRTRERPGSLHILTTRGLNILTTRGLNILAARRLHVLTTRGLHILTTRRLNILTARGLHILTARRLNILTTRRLNILAARRLHVRTTWRLDLTRTRNRAWRLDGVGLRRPGTQHLLRLRDFSGALGLGFDGRCGEGGDRERAQQACKYSLHCVLPLVRVVRIDCRNAFAVPNPSVVRARSLPPANTN